MEMLEWIKELDEKVELNKYQRSAVINFINTLFKRFELEKVKEIKELLEGLNEAFRIEIDIIKESGYNLNKITESFLK